jgi:hypothetical protein
MRNKPDKRVDRESFWLATSGFRAKKIKIKRARELLCGGRTQNGGAAVEAVFSGL